MSETTLADSQVSTESPVKSAGRAKFIVGGLIILAAVAYLIISSLATELQSTVFIFEEISLVGCLFPDCC